MHIVVIDGQGGGIGKVIVSQLRKVLPAAKIIAVGTNVQATAAMLKAGATQAATGENAICYQSSKAEIIMGVIGILQANAMLGEISPAIAASVSSSPAEKILIPMNQCRLHIPGLEQKSLDLLVNEAVQLAAWLFNHHDENER